MEKPCLKVTGVAAQDGGSTVSPSQSAMKHRIKDGLIEMVKIINPCFYWVRCSECPKLEDIQSLLKDQISPVSSISFGDRVIIRYFDGGLYRGVVQEPGTLEDLDDQFYEIFLLDMFKIIKVTALDIYKFKNSQLEMDFDPPHVIGLCGGKPINAFEYVRMLDDESLENFAKEKIIELFKPCSSFEFWTSDDIDVTSSYCVFGKVILNTKKGTKSNLLKCLLTGGLVRCLPDFMDSLLETGCMDNVIAEAAWVDELINFTKTKLEDEEEVVLTNMSPPPELKFDEKKMNEFRDIIRTSGWLSNPWDVPVPIFRCESFSEYNNRMSRAARKGRQKENEQIVGHSEKAACNSEVNKMSLSFEEAKRGGRRSEKPVARSVKFCDNAGQFDDAPDDSSLFNSDRSCSFTDSVDEMDVSFSYCDSSLESYDGILRMNKDDSVCRDGLDGKPPTKPSSPLIDVPLKPSSSKIQLVSNEEESVKSCPISPAASSCSSVNIPSLLLINQRRLSRNVSGLGRGVLVHSERDDSDAVSCSSGPSPQEPYNGVILGKPSSNRQFGNDDSIGSIEGNTSCSPLDPGGRGKLFAQEGGSSDEASNGPSFRGPFNSFSHGKPVSNRPFGDGDSVGSIERNASRSPLTPGGLGKLFAPEESPSDEASNWSSFPNGFGRGKPVSNRSFGDGDSIGRIDRNASRSPLTPGGGRGKLFAPEGSPSGEASNGSSFPNGFGRGKPVSNRSFGHGDSIGNIERSASCSPLTAGGGRGKLFAPEGSPSDEASNGSSFGGPCNGFGRGKPMSNRSFGEDDSVGSIERNASRSPLTPNGRGKLFSRERSSSDEAHPRGYPGRGNLLETKETKNEEEILPGSIGREKLFEIKNKEDVPVKSVINKTRETLSDEADCRRSKLLETENKGSDTKSRVDACKSNSPCGQVNLCDVMSEHPPPPAKGPSPVKRSPHEIFRSRIILCDKENDQVVQSAVSPTKLETVKELPVKKETSAIYAGTGRGSFAQCTKEKLKDNRMFVCEVNRRPRPAASTSSLLSHEYRVGNFESGVPSLSCNYPLPEISTDTWEATSQIVSLSSVSSEWASENEQPVNQTIQMSNEEDISSNAEVSSHHSEKELTTALTKMTLEKDRRSPNDELEKSNSKLTTDSSVKPSSPCFAAKSEPVGVASSDVDMIDDSVEGSAIWRAGPLVKLSQSLQSSCGIQHGSTDIRPAKYIADLSLDDKITQVLHRAHFRLLTRPQTFTMPAILGRKNVVLVGPAGSKKSSACVIPVMNLLLDKDYYSVMRPGNGPRFVIVAPTAGRVRELRMHCTNLQVIPPQFIIPTHAGGLEMERKEELTTGCEVLITTPRCWLRLLKYYVITNMSRLCHLLLDQYDTLRELFAPELEEICRKVEALGTLREKKGGGFEELKVQTIVNAEQWSGALESHTTKILKNPIVVITSYVEALLYAGIRPTVSLVKAELKCAKVQELINEYTSKKIVIFCNTPEEIEEIQKEVACTGRNFIPAHGKMEKSDLNEVPNQWNCSKKPPVLLRTDDTVDDFCITDAHVLIHFNLPQSKSTFSERFAVLREQIPDRIRNPEIGRAQCDVHVLFDDEGSEAPFPFMVELLQRFHVRASPEILEVVKSIQLRKEKEKTTQFCERILSCGRCHKESACPERHVFLPEVDKPHGNLRSQGLIKVEILETLSAVKFAVRILAFNPDPKGIEPWRTVGSSKYIRLKAKMTTYFKSSNNRRLHGHAKPGDVLAHKYDLDDNFERARVVEITEWNERKEPTEVKLLRMDLGEQIEAKSHTLFELPEEFQHEPDQAVFVYVGNLKPMDLDSAWSFIGSKSVRQEVIARKKEATPNEEIIGKVLFTVGQNYVVDDLRWRRNLEHCSVSILCIRKFIKSRQLGLDNPEYTENMKKLFSEAFGDDQSKGERPEKRRVEERQTPPSWAHLSTGEDYISVTATAVQSPSLFFVTMDKHIKRHAELQKDIRKALCENKCVLSSPTSGNICVTERSTAAANEKMWHRCKVQHVENGEATVFFVDTGETHSVPVDELYSIPWKFVSELPFQAIECSLSGIQQFLNSDDVRGPNQVRDEFQQMISTYSVKGVCVKVVKLEIAKSTEGRCHQVIMLSVEEQKVVNLNEKLVKICLGDVQMPAFDVDDAKVLSLRGCTEPPAGVENDDSDEDCGTPNEPLLPPGGGSLNLAPEPPLELNWNEIDLEELREFATALFCQNVPEAQMNGIRQITQGPASGPDQRIAPRNETSEAQDPANLRRSSKPSAPPVTEIEPLSLLEPAFEFKNPEVIWRQDPCMVVVKFKIPCLKNYVVRSNVSSLFFSGFVEGMDGREVYAKHIFFFGPVRLMSEKLDGMSLTVKLYKIVSGYDWPRLTYSSARDRGIKIDSVSPDDEDDRPLIQQYLEKGKRALFQRGTRKSAVQSTEATAVSDDEYEVEDYSRYDRLKVGVGNYFDFEG